MPTKINDATPIAMLTVGQLEDLTRAWVRSELAGVQQQAADQETRSKRHAYGLKGLAKLLGCSVTRACQINTSGVIEPALTRFGNLLIFDSDLVLELLRKNKDNKNRRKA